jgi:quercetin dioxygenase-like cupin family protein
MKVSRADEAASKPAGTEHFSGEVQMSPRVVPETSTSMTVTTVAFAPGARTDWHTHPGGQTLLVIEGRGRVRSAGGAGRTIATGDVVWVSPGERHWHGADPDSGMVHVSVTIGDGTSWESESVSDAEYLEDPIG